MRAPSAHSRLDFISLQHTSKYPPETFDIVKLLKHLAIFIEKFYLAQPNPQVGSATQEKVYEAQKVLNALLDVVLLKCIWLLFNS